MFHKQGLAQQSIFTHQIGDKVTLSLGASKFPATILAVSFYPGKVKYNLYLPLLETRLLQIDSVFVDKL